VRETIIAVEVDAGVGVVAAEPLSSPGVVFVLALQNVVCRLEERLLDIEDAVDVEHRHNVESNILQ
jgi:hypothetical protein